MLKIVAAFLFGSLVTTGVAQIVTSPLVDVTAPIGFFMTGGTDPDGIGRILRVDREGRAICAPAQ